MARQIDIKGIRDGLLIRVNDAPDVAVYERLRRELEQKRDFLQGGRVTVELGRRAMNREQLTGLQELFAAHDLELWAVIAEDGETRATARELGLVGFSVARLVCQWSAGSPRWRPRGFPMDGHEDSPRTARAFPGVVVLSCGRRGASPPCR